MSDIFEIIKQNMDLEDIDTVNYSPLTFAYIGDAIYELVIRTMIVDEANRSAMTFTRCHLNMLRLAHKQSLLKY